MEKKLGHQLDINLQGEKGKKGEWPELSVRGIMEVIKLHKVFCADYDGYKTIGDVKTHQTVHLKTVVIYSKIPTVR